MKTYHLKFRSVDKKNFDQLKSGEKSIETRAGTMRYKDTKVGDKLEISCGDEKITKIIQAIQHYDSVESIFQSADWSRVMPGVATLDDAKAAYFDYPGYKEKIDEHGIFAF